jgi:hypothetical protein
VVNADKLKHDGHDPKTTCPNCGHRFVPERADKRTIGWLYRIRLYDVRDQETAVADTDPEKPADHPGEAVARGLGGVFDDLVFMVNEYHGGRPVTGLDNETLKRKARGVRPTVSRHGGHATVRVRYQANERDWLARIDIKRQETP